MTDCPMLYTIRETARLLSLSARSVERLICAGRLPSRRIGRRRLVPAAAVRQLAGHDLARIAADAQDIRP